MKKLEDLRKVIFQYMNEENEKERLQLIQDNPGESVYIKDGVDLRDGGVYCIYCNSKDHPGEHYCMRCLTHEHDQSECPKEVMKKTSLLKEKEATQPPKKKKKSTKIIRPPDKEQQEKERQKVLDELQKVAMETQLEQSRELHWDYGDDPKAKEIFENYYKDRNKEKDLEKKTPKSKVKVSEPNIYCNDCKRNHWGPCRCIVCDKTGHDEENCPTFRYALHLSESDEKKGTRKKIKTPKSKYRDECLYCKICKEWGKHTTIDCPAQDRERKIKKEKRDKEPYCHHCKQWGHVSVQGNMHNVYL